MTDILKIKERLKMIKTLDALIDSKLSQVSRLRAVMERTSYFSNGSPVSRSKNYHFMEDNICKIVDLEREIDFDVDRLVELKREIYALFSKVENGELRLVLEEKYINLRTFEEIAERLHYSARHVQRLHRSALEMLVRVLEVKRGLGGGVEKTTF